TGSGGVPCKALVRQIAYYIGCVTDCKPQPCHRHHSPTEFHWLSPCCGNGRRMCQRLCMRYACG
ncbi:hypothetical protein KKC91_01360, partial [bacterium]|nr:hypothetical protein [bacterium]